MYKILQLYNLGHNLETPQVQPIALRKRIRAQTDCRANYYRGRSVEKFLSKTFEFTRQSGIGCNQINGRFDQVIGVDKTKSRFSECFKRLFPCVVDEILQSYTTDCPTSDCPLLKILGNTHRLSVLENFGELHSF